MRRWLPLLLLAAGLASGAPLPFRFVEQHDWPQFRGPNRDNLSPDKGLLKAWPPEGPKLSWKGEGVGVGFSSVTVVRDKVFTMGEKDGSLLVFALDRATGKQAWSAKVGKAGAAGPYGGSRSTPSSDGRLVFALGQAGEFVALDVRTGAEKWRRELVKEFGGKAGSFGYAESPLVDGAHVICTPGGAKATMVALDRATGKEAWQCPAGMNAGYSSAVVSKGGGVRHYVQLTVGGTIGVAAKDGALLWRYDKLANTTANAATPVILGESVFTSAGFNKGGALLELTGMGGAVAAREKYFKPELKNKYGGVTAAGDYVYADTDSEGKPWCAEWKTGVQAWQRLPGVGKGVGGVSLTHADGHLYMLYENGVVALVPATPKGYSESGSFKIPGSTNSSRAAPVVCGGRLYVRDKDAVWCYDVRAK